MADVVCSERQIILLLVMFSVALGIQFELMPGKRRCIMDEVPANVFINGLYNITADPNSDPSVQMQLQVLDSKGETVYWKPGATHGKFVFVVDRDDRFMVCFETKLPEEFVKVRGMNMRDKALRYVNLTLINTMSFEAHREQRKHEWNKLLNMTGLEKEVIMLQEFAEILLHQTNELSSDLYRKRNVRSYTGSLCLAVSVLAMITLIGLGAWQVLYLRHYFRSKKIIE